MKKKILFIAAFLVVFTISATASFNYTTIDDFEDGDKSEYTGGDNAGLTVQSNTIIEGTYTGNITTEGGDNEAFWNPNQKISQGDSFSYITRLETEGRFNGGFALVQDANNRYVLRFQEDSDYIALSKFVSGSYTKVKEKSIDWDNDVNYRWEVNWTTSDTFNMDLYYHNNDSKVLSFSVTDSSFTWGYAGFLESAGAATTGETAYWDGKTINSPPSIDSTKVKPQPLKTQDKADTFMNASDSDGDDVNGWLTVEEDGTTIKNDVNMNEPKTNEFELLDIVTIDKQDVFYNFTFIAGDGISNTTKEVGKYIQDLKPGVQVFKPKNKTYGTDDIKYNVTVNDDGDDVPGENVTVRLYDDGSEFRNESIIEGSGAFLTGTISGQSDGNYTFTAKAIEPSGETSQDFREYEVDTTPPSTSIEDPEANSTTLDLDSIALNHVTKDKNLDSGSCKYDIDTGTNFSLNSCGNTTFPVGEYGTHNVTVWAKDTVGNWGKTTVEWFADELNVVRAEDKGTGKNLSDFSVTFDNGTATEGGTASGYNFYVNTSDLPQGDTTIKVAKSGYVPVNESLNVTKDFELNKTYSLEKSGITLETFDEQKKSNQLVFNFTASNSTTSYTNKTVNKTFSEVYQNFDNIGFPTGEVTITPVDYKGEYKKRNYFVDIDQFSKIDLDTYLLKDGQGIFVGIETVDGNGDAVPNALITIQREFGATYKTVAQDKTASDGTVSMYLDPDIQYRVVASHPNYETFTGTFSPANYQFDNLIIQLGEKSNLTQSTVWDKVEYKLEPQPMTLNATGNYTFNWTVVDPESGLQEWGLRIKNGTGQVLKKKSVTGSPSGGTTSITVNVSKQGFDSGEELVAAGYFFKDKDGNTKEFVYERTYQVRGWIAAGIASFKKLLGSADGAGDTAKGIIALFATLFIGGKLKSRFGKKGGGMVSLVVLGMFTLMGWFPGYIFLVTILALVGIYSLR